MIKYKVTWTGKILQEEVERETEKFVVLKNGNREGKSTAWESWFDSWEDAHLFLVENAQKKVDDIRRGLEIAKGHLGNIKGMRKAEKQ
jgi:hypothetical protein